MGQDARGAAGGVVVRNLSRERKKGEERHMNWSVALAAFVASAAGVAGGFMGVWWRLERRQRREAEVRIVRMMMKIARAHAEVALIRTHLLHFPTRWESPLKALRCAGKALETLEGTERAISRMTIHKSATCGASEIDGKAAEHGA